MGRNCAQQAQGACVPEVEEREVNLPFALRLSAFAWGSELPGEGPHSVKLQTPTTAASSACAECLPRAVVVKPRRPESAMQR